VSALTSNVDIAPTILEAAHVQTPTTMQGESLLPLISSPKDKSVLNQHTEAFGHFYESYDGEHKVAKYVALATQRYKIIFYYELNEWELFDLQKDPTESLNLAQSDKHAKLLGEMKSKLAHKMESIQEDLTVIQQVKAGLQQTHQKQPNASKSLSWRY
jgi:arylsulfatase A-like enzyme